MSIKKSLEFDVEVVERRNIRYRIDVTDKETFKINGKEFGEISDAHHEVDRMILKEGVFSTFYENFKNNGDAQVEMRRSID